MKYYIIAGEASGDLHGSNLILQLHNLDTAANIRCWGGNLMENAGATLVKHYSDLAFMGFAEVIKNLPTILKNIRFCKQDILQFKPDVLVLIDYPGFNLRIADWAKQQGLKVVYYIAPQVWAWKADRVKKMKLCIDRLLVILPFEKKYFLDNWQWNVTYVGHPLVEVVQKYLDQNTAVKPISHKPIIALLPGSRKQEIEKKLPVMLAVSNFFPDYQFVVAKAPGLTNDFYQPFLAPFQNVTAVENSTYSVLQQAKAALVTSGTATLETALFKVPQIVCYKSSAISYAIGKRLVKIKFISLVNLIMDQLVVKELIQHEMTTTLLVENLKDLLADNQKTEEILQKYNALYENLSTSGNASLQAANNIIDVLNSK